MIRSTLIAVLFAFSGLAFADDFNYNSVTASYSKSDVDIENCCDLDGDILAIDASVAIGESFYAFGSYGKGDVDADIPLVGPVSGDLDAANVGLGFHMPLSESIDLVTGVSYEYMELSDSGGSIDDNGIGVGVGLRIAASNNFEIATSINYADIGDFGDDTSLSANFLYNVNDSFSVGVGGTVGDDSTAYGVGGRFYFGE